MNPIEALKQIESALNIAVQRGIFADLQSATVVFQSLQILKNEFQRNDITDPGQ